MQTFVNIFSLLGSLGLFLYGMKIMSEGLEKFAGDRLRNLLAAMTKNRVMGVLTGISVTALIQSSSATTVMVISFVNAGLMTLTQAIGVIMGANVGTTVTAWIISAIGFKVNVAAFALPLLAIGIPLVFSGNSQRKSIGEFVFGPQLLAGVGRKPSGRQRRCSDAGKGCRRWLLHHHLICHCRSTGDNAGAGLGSYNGNHPDAV